MNARQIKLLKQAFPQLRNLQGRFFALFLQQLEREVEDWVRWARKELNGRKCFDGPINWSVCELCRHYEGGSCRKAPSLGQDFGFGSAVLKHPNTDEWYWCFCECPDFEGRRGSLNNE